MKRICPECNQEIRSHSNAFRHRACFIKFKAFDKKEWAKKDREKNRERYNAYARAYSKRVDNRCKDCNAFIVPTAVYCKVCIYKYPEICGYWKGGITMDRKRYNQLSRALEVGHITIERIQKIYENNIKKHGTLTCYF